MTTYDIQVLLSLLGVLMLNGLTSILPTYLVVKARSQYGSLLPPIVFGRWVNTLTWILSREHLSGEAGKDGAPDASECALDTRENLLVIDWKCAPGLFHT